MGVGLKHYKMPFTFNSQSVSTGTSRLRCDAMYECILLIEKDVENNAVIRRVRTADERGAGKSDTAYVTLGVSLCSH